MVKFRKVETDKTSGAVGPYPQATQIGEFIFISGQLPVDPKIRQKVE